MQNKFSFFILTLLISAAAVSCATTSVSSKTDSAAAGSKNTIPTATIKMYDNCPQETRALKIETALMATIEGYRGMTEAIFTQMPSKKNIGDVTEYIAACTSIKKALEDGKAVPCTLSFATTADGEGQVLDFSSEEKIIQTLSMMITAGIQQVYARYTF